MSGDGTASEVTSAVLFYLLTTTALTFFNKWFLSVSELHFHFPLAITAMHHFFVTIFILLTEPWLEKLFGPISRRASYWVTVAPIGIMCGFDWGTSNYSLQFITLSLYEMIKSTTPVFVLLFSFCVGLQRPAPLLLLAMAIIGVGAYLSLCGFNGAEILFKDKFPIWGAAVCLLSSLFAGARSVMSQIVMQRLIDPFSGKCEVNAITTMYYVSPGTAASVFVLVVFLEGEAILAYIATQPAINLVWLIAEMFVSAWIVFGVSISGFILTRKTCALTYSIIQIGERVLIVALAMLTFGDQVGIWNAIGFGLTLSGIALYNYYKIRLQHLKGDHAQPVSTPSGARTMYLLTPTEAMSRRANFVSVDALIVGDVDSSPMTTPLVRKRIEFPGHFNEMQVLKLPPPVKRARIRNAEDPPPPQRKQTMFPKHSGEATPKETTPLAADSAPSRYGGA